MKVQLETTHLRLSFDKSSMQEALHSKPRPGPQPATAKALRSERAGRKLPGLTALPGRDLGVTTEYLVYMCLGRLTFREP